MSKETEEFITYHHNPIVAAKDRQIKELSDVLKLALNDCDHTITEQARAQVELALAEAQANQEKIGATVQAARASATHFYGDKLGQPKPWKSNVRLEIEQKLVILQAQRDELVIALRDLVDVNERIGVPTISKGGLCEEQDWAHGMRQARAAIARATEGGTGQ